MKSSQIHRRQAMATAALIGASMTSFAQTAKAAPGLRQSICRWCYGRMPLEQLCEVAKRIGYESIELLNPPDVKVVRQHGLKCAVLNGGPSIKITSCLNRPENHDRNIKDLTDAIDFAAANDVPQVICFSGNRAGMPDEVGLQNCATGLKKIVGHAEAKKITLIMELLNSKVDHKDYMCDHTTWGADLVKAVGSPRFKLLYDIYHMQIMEGDVIRTIKQHKDAIAHYHTGGVPGRNEIDVGQELNYSAICQAIRATGFTGYLGQEFMPKREPAKSLEEAFRICSN